MAEHVGLGKSSLFHHFASKAELYAAVVARILAVIEERLMRALAAGGSAIDRLDRWIDVLVDLLAERRTYARILLRSLFEDDELTGELPGEREANEIIRRIVARGRGAAEGRDRVRRDPTGQCRPHAPDADRGHRVSLRVGRVR